MSTVKTSGTGQDPHSWHHGLLDNIPYFCGESVIISDSDNNGEDLDTLVDGFDYDTGESANLFGVSFTPKFENWLPGEDLRVCIAKAIRQSTCPQVNLMYNECIQIKLDYQT